LMRVVTVCRLNSLCTFFVLLTLRLDILCNDNQLRRYTRCKMTNRYVKELVDFINVFQILPRHVSASGCHHQGVVGAL
jgi:hypothetical protein